MRKLSIVLVALLGLSFLASCGDDPDEAKKMAQNCVDLGNGDESQCECVGEKASDEFSTSEYNDALEGKNEEVATKYQDIVTECGGGTVDDGTGDDGTDTGS